ncbi:MAG: hypothetical protein M1368_06515 [Thaumarchaeota archaeon]|nr:hypothetical protein [Nitrososphaerota archaeon]
MKNSKALTALEHENYVSGPMSSRWAEGLENHEKLKRLLPFLEDDEGYL